MFDESVVVWWRRRRRRHCNDKDESTPAEQINCEMEARNPIDAEQSIFTM